eukprot:5464378-Amphidinium_carterae.1
MVKFIRQGDLRSAGQKCLNLCHNAAKPGHPLNQRHEMPADSAMLVNRRSQTNGLVRWKGSIR